MKEGELMKETLKGEIMKGRFALHFDGKKIKNSEYQEVCMRSEQKEIKLGVLKCNGSASESIFQKIKEQLDFYSAWEVIDIIIADTTAVNTEIMV